MKPVLMALGALALAGCAATPKAPSPAVFASPPQAWSAPHLDQRAADPAWWTALGSSELNDLVADALARNADLRVAEANLRAARAFAQETAAEARPLGAISAEVGRQRAAALSQPQVLGSPDRFDDQTIADVSGGLSWEIDVAGRLAAANRAAVADAQQASALRRQAAALTIAATVRAYADHQAASELEGLLDARARQLAELRDRLQGAQRAGGASRGDVAAAEEALQSLLAQLPELEARKHDAARRLAVLTGKAPVGALPAPTGRLLDPDTVQVADPATMLRSRPDVAAAEQRLSAAVARAGMARADLYPRITLLGAGGLSAAPGDFGESGALGFSMGPRLSWGIFDLGRIRARIAAADAQTDAALAQWESTALRALEEADGALESWDAARRAALAAARAAEAAREERAMALARLQAGAASPLDQVRADADWLAAEAAAQEARARRQAAWINTHLALGVGASEARNP